MVVRVEGNGDLKNTYKTLASRAEDER